MNWYRFKVELSAWLAGTALCTFTTVACMAMVEGLSDTTTDMVYWTPGEQLVNEHPWLFPVVIMSLIGTVWATALRALHIMRSNKRYGER